MFRKKKNKKIENIFNEKKKKEERRIKNCFHDKIYIGS